MKNKTKVFGGICIMTLGLGMSSQATTFDLTFTDFNSVVQGYGVVNGTENLNGSYTLTSGYWDVVAGPEAGWTGTLFPNPSVPNYTTSPSGYFYYDNLLTPDSPGVAIADYWGLLFTTAGSPTEANLYSDSTAQYDQYFNNGNDTLGILSVQEQPAGTVAPTPDGASCASLLGGAFVIMAVGRRHFKK